MTTSNTSPSPLSGKFTTKTLSKALSAAFMGVAMISHNAVANTLIPASGRLLIVGQELDTVNQYVSAMGTPQIPGGVIEYLTLTPDQQDGKLDALAARFPNSALAVGLDLGTRLPEINSGALDWRLKSIINKLKSYNRPIYLRFGYEFEGAWNRYDPTQYQIGWRRVHTLIQQANAQRNIALVWQSAAHCGDNGGLPTKIDAWYPGDRFVDFVGLSFFTPGLMAAPERGSCNVANQRLDEVAAFAKAHAKPLMIAEATPRGFSVGHLTWQQSVYGGAPLPAPIPVPVADITLWYKNFFAWINKNDVKIVSYINTNWDASSFWQNQSWGDARVEANPTIKAYWTSNIATGYVKANNGVATSVGFAPGINSIMVRARGTLGKESVTLRVNNIAVKTWVLSKNTTETPVQTTLQGKVTLHFTNDAVNSDVQVDYINVNGNVRQAQDQTINTGVYQGGKCGGVGPNGAGKSEWLHCNGYIDFGTI